jgi:hypothetical protein
VAKILREELGKKELAPRGRLVKPFALQTGMLRS